MLRFMENIIQVHTISLQLDLIYIQNYSIFLDIKLILMTIKIMFMKESTEGFTEEQRKDIQEKE